MVNIINVNVAVVMKKLLIITNEEYSSIAMAARAINMNQFTLREQLIGKYLNKTNLKLKNE